jgi:hypothetical protein
MTSKGTSNSGQWNKQQRAMEQATASNGTSNSEQWNKQQRKQSVVRTRQNIPDRSGKTHAGTVRSRTSQKEANE